MLGFDGNAISTHALFIPAILGARAEDGTHVLLRPCHQILTFSKPDLGWTAMQCHVAPVDAARKKHMILVVLAAHDRAEAFPTDKVVAHCDHEGAAATEMGRFDSIRDRTAIGCVADIEASFDLGDAW